jgi:hypothetical protein
MSALMSDCQAENVTESPRSFWVVNFQFSIAHLKTHLPSRSFRILISLPGNPSAFVLEIFYQQLGLAAITVLFTSPSPFSFSATHSQSLCLFMSPAIHTLSYTVVRYLNTCAVSVPYFQDLSEYLSLNQQSFSQNGA